MPINAEAARLTYIERLVAEVDVRAASEVMTPAQAKDLIELVKLGAYQYRCPSEMFTDPVPRCCGLGLTAEGHKKGFSFDECRECWNKEVREWKQRLRQ